MSFFLQPVELNKQGDIVCRIKYKMIIRNLKSNIKFLPK